MPNRATGDISQRQTAATEAADILDSAPAVSADNNSNNWRAVYSTPGRKGGTVVAGLTDNQAKAGVGFYNGFGAGDLFAPPIEFGGYGGSFGGSAYYSPFDSFSNPARYQYGSYNGYMGKEGWVYSRGGYSSIDHMRIAQCLLLYKTEGVVQTVVHLLADFTTENVNITHPDDSVNKFYKSWMTKVKLKRVIHRIVIDLLTTGNVFIWTKLAKLKNSEKNAMKRGIAAQLIGNDLVVTVKNKKLKEEHRTISVSLQDDEIAIIKDLASACESNASKGRVDEIISRAKGDSRNHPSDQKQGTVESDTGAEIPWGYTSLNPLQMEPRGSRFGNEHRWVMMIRQRDIQPLSKFMTYRYYDDIATTKVNLPKMFKGKLNPVDGKRRRQGYAAELELDPERLAIIQDVTKADYEQWATPQIYPAHKEVEFKRMLRQGEISAMESLKHMITLVKLGDVKDGYIPTEEQIERVAAALAGGSQTHHLIWDNLIEGQVLQPNLGNIFDPKKYQEIDKDIYAALGISESVMTGQGSYANSFLSIKLLLEKLETIRELVEDWLRVEIKKIADAMSFKRLPQISWGLMNLRDENTERKLWIDLYDRGIVSDQSLLERFGTDFDIELARQELEKTIKDLKNDDLLDDTKVRAPVMVSRGPFNRDLISKKGKGQGQGPEGKRGRPPQTGKPQETKRETKPKGMASVLKFQKALSFAEDAIKTVNNAATKMAVDANNLKDQRQFTRAQKEDLEEIVLHTLSVLDIEQNIDDNLVYNLLEDVDEEKFKSTRAQSIVSLYRTELKNLDNPSKDDRFNLMCSAFATVNSNLLEG